MVKKKFIDKKNAVTYNLIFRSTEDADDAPGRMLAEAGSVGMGKVDANAAEDAGHATSTERRYPPGHPLAWLEAEQYQEEIPEARRRELIELGFPDDGYDYLSHVRALGHGSASLEGLRTSGVAAGTSGSGSAPDEAPQGPSVYVPAGAAAPPQEDVALFDASGLTVMQAAGEEAEATGMMGGVTAFSRPKRPDAARGADRRELQELEAAMRELEEADGAEEGEIGAAQGVGDLLDDFIVAATDAGGDAARGADRTAAAAPKDDDHAALWSSDGSYSDSEDGEEKVGIVGGSAAGAPHRAGSIASTYWREERTDRRSMLGVIDERFEALALQYDEDEIGDMEDSAEAGAIAGRANVGEFDALMDEFLEERGRAEQYRGGGLHAPRVHSALKAELEAAGLDDNDAAITIQRTKEAIWRMEAAEAAGVAEPAEVVELAPVERWDCETVLSLRSNLYNHPGTITEPPSRWAQRPGVIKLNKAGLPVGALLVQRAGGAGAAAPAAPAVGDGAAAPAVPLERRKDESAEEKKARKEAVKTAKREARATKKQLKGVYKEEAAKAQRRAATAQVQPRSGSMALL